MTGRDLDEIRSHASSFQTPSRFRAKDQNGIDKDDRGKKNHKIDAIREEEPSDSSPPSLVCSESTTEDRGFGNSMQSGQSQKERSSASPGSKSKVSRRFQSLENLAVHHQVRN